MNANLKIRCRIQELNLSGTNYEFVAETARPILRAIGTFLSIFYIYRVCPLYFPIIYYISNLSNCN